MSVYRELDSIASCGHTGESDVTRRMAAIGLKNEFFTILF
jgi:hypothetical protein